MCNNVPNVQHFFGEFRCCTLGAPGVIAGNSCCNWKLVTAVATNGWLQAHCNCLLLIAGCNFNQLKQWSRWVSVTSLQSAINCNSCNQLLIARTPISLQTALSNISAIFQLISICRSGNFLLLIAKFHKIFVQLLNCHGMELTAVVHDRPLEPLRIRIWISLSVFNKNFSLMKMTLESSSSLLDF